MALIHPDVLEALSSSALLYTPGLSTDPYGNSNPHGVGVLTATTELLPVELDGNEWQAQEWLGPDRLLVSRPTRRTNPLTGRKVSTTELWTYRYSRSSLRAEGRAPVPAPTPQVEWSPDGSLVAYSKARWLRRGWASSDRIWVARVDGTEREAVARGALAGWAPDGELLYSPPGNFDRVEALDLETQARTTLLDGSAIAAAMGVPGRIRFSGLAFSGDGAYVAAHAGAPEGIRAVSTVVIARADGTFVRLLTSRYIISLVTWSPEGDRLAYSTSGFPDPHELFVLDSPLAKPRRIFKGSAHFDWVTWSPDGRWLLLDDENNDRWLLFPVAGEQRPHWVPRMGGRPLWCCPQNDFTSGWG